MGYFNSRLVVDIVTEHHFVPDWWMEIYNTVVCICVSQSLPYHHWIVPNLFLNKNDAITTRSLSTFLVLLSVYIQLQIVPKTKHWYIPVLLFDICNTRWQNYSGLRYSVFLLVKTTNRHLCLCFTQDSSTNSGKSVLSITGVQSYPVYNK